MEDAWMACGWRVEGVWMVAAWLHDCFFLKRTCVAADRFAAFGAYLACPAFALLQSAPKIRRQQLDYP